MSKFDNNRAKVLLGCLYLYNTSGLVTMRAISDAAGLSLGCTHEHLKGLRREGLVAWDDGKHGTLRPLVTEVPEWAA